MKHLLRMVAIAFSIACFSLSVAEGVFILLSDRTASFTLLCFSAALGVASFIILIVDSERNARLFHQLDIAVSHSSCMVFEYYASTDMMTIISSKFDNAGKKIAHVSTSLVQDETIHPTDAVQFFNTYRQLVSGKQNLTCILRLRLYPHAIDYHWYRIALSSRRDSDGVSFALGTLEDIDEQQKREMLLQQEADRDFLTGLLNRVSCQRDIDTFLTVRSGDGTHALLLLDLNGFKKVNDTLGHMTGDDLLKRIAVTMQSVFRGSDMVGRLGGDEFIVFLKDITCEAAVRKAQGLVDAISSEYAGDSCQVKVTGSVGVAFSFPGCTFSDLYAMADEACYQAKKTPNGAVSVFESK